MRTASLGFLALRNSCSASAKRPSSSKYIAYLAWISGNLSLEDVLAKSKANSKALQIITRLKKSFLME